MSGYHSINVEGLKRFMPPESENLRGYVNDDGMQILLSVDHGRRHMSISTADRIPTWDEIKHAREQFLPLGKHFVLALPPSQHYVNRHPYTMHLWECLPERESDLIWTFEQG